MRLQHVRGLPVVDPVTARKVGVVADYRMDAVSGQLAALEVHAAAPAAGKSAEPGELVPAAAIRRLGQHAVMLTGEPAATPPPAADDDTWLTSRSLVGLSVLDESGSVVGRLADAEIDPDSLAVTAYLLEAPPLQRLLGQPGRQAAFRVVSSSRELLVVATPEPQPAPALAEPEPTPAPAPVEPVDTATKPVAVPVLKAEDRPAPAVEGDEPPAGDAAPEPPTKAGGVRHNGRQGG
jgi:sporulation protein YlmC with PRC-barrel domain